MHNNTTPGQDTTFGDITAAGGAATTGARDVVDIDEQLPADDPNVAATAGVYNHLDHIGDDSDEDLGVDAAAGELLPVPEDGA